MAGRTRTVFNRACNLSAYLLRCKTGFATFRFLRVTVHAAAIEIKCLPTASHQVALIFATIGDAIRTHRRLVPVTEAIHLWYRLTAAQRDSAFICRYFLFRSIACVARRIYSLLKRFARYDFLKQISVPVSVRLTAFTLNARRDISQFARQLIA